MLTKDETDQRWRKKVEAVMKRERALAYAYSHKVIRLLFFSLVYHWTQISNESIVAYASSLIKKYSQFITCLNHSKLKKSDQHMRFSSSVEPNAFKHSFYSISVPLSTFIPYS